MNRFCCEFALSGLRTKIGVVLLAPPLLFVQQRRCPRRMRSLVHQQSGQMQREPRPRGVECVHCRFSLVGAGPRTSSRTASQIDEHWKHTHTQTSAPLDSTESRSDPLSLSQIGYYFQGKLFFHQLTTTY